MADPRAVVVVTLILLSGIAVGALAGYRMHLHEAWNDSADPLMVNVTVEYPDGASLNASVVVQGSKANALGALEAALPDDTTLGVRATTFGVYVHTIGAYRAEGQCGWMYSIGAKGEAFQPDRAADREAVAEDDHIFWYWGCL